MFKRTTTIIVREWFAVPLNTNKASVGRPCSHNECSHIPPPSNHSSLVPEKLPHSVYDGQYQTPGKQARDLVTKPSLAVTLVPSPPL